jgi:serine phosphatase RsbU (regulator of sigma subunit)
MVASASSSVAFFAAFVGVALAFSLIHLLLYAFEPRQRPNLFFALMAASLAAVALGDLHHLLGTDSLGLYHASPHRLFVAALIGATSRFVFALFMPRAPVRYWVYLATISGLLLASLFEPRLWEIPAALLGLVVIGDALQTIARRWRELGEGGWVMAVGMGAFGLGGAGQLSLDLVPWNHGLHPYLWGGAVMLVAISIYLARSFARTQRQLEVKLKEVEVLSAQRLAQERAAREREVERRVLEADHRRKTEELEEARRLQVALLPAAPPEHPGLEIAAHMWTASEVGGDLYDFHVDPDRGLTLAIGDAVGHGARAGALVSAVKSLSQLVLGRGSLEGQLESFSAALKGMGLPRAHVALGLARFGDGGAEMASAGMPPPLVRRAGRGAVEEVAISGMPLGGPLRAPYRGATVELRPDDVVLLFSDGLPELPDQEGRVLGYEGARELLGRVVGPSAEEVLRELLGAVEAHTGGAAPPDDVTLIVVRVLPGNPRP